MVDEYNLGWDKSELQKEILARDPVKIRNQMEERSRKQMAGNLNFELGENYSTNVRNLYKRCFKEDHLIAKYFCNIVFLGKFTRPYARSARRRIAESTPLTSANNSNRSETSY